MMVDDLPGGIDYLDFSYNYPESETTDIRPPNILNNQDLMEVGLKDWT